MAETTVYENDDLLALSGDNSLYLKGEADGFRLNGNSIDLPKATGVIALTGSTVADVGNGLELDSNRKASVKIDSKDNVLSTSTSGVGTTLALSAGWNELKTNYRLRLLGKANAIVSDIDASEFVKDGMLDSVELSSKETTGGTEHYMVFTWNTDGGKKTLDVEISKFMNIYTASDGVKMEDNNFSTDWTKVASVTGVAETYTTKNEFHTISNAFSGDVVNWNTLGLKGYYNYVKRISKLFGICSTDDVASVVIDGRVKYYEKLQDALNAATSDGVSEATVTILQHYGIPAGDGSLVIMGKGYDKTKVTIINDKNVDFTDQCDNAIGGDSSCRSVSINGATVIFKGTGSWTRNCGTHSMFSVGEGNDSGKPVVATEDAAYAEVYIEGGTFAHNLTTAAAHVWNVQNGKIVFNNGKVNLQYNQGGSKYCIRAEKSEVGAGTKAGSVIVNGGNFVTWNSQQHLLARDGGTLKITGTNITTFNNNGKVANMNSYLADGYEFVKNETDGLYYVTAKA